MTPRRVAALCGLVVLALTASAPALAGTHKRVTARERAEAAQLLAPMKAFKAAADARNAELTAAMAAAEEEARRCPPPRGVPSATPRSLTGMSRLFTAFSADVYHRAAFAHTALRAELVVARDRYRRIHPHTRAFRALAESRAADLAALLHMTRFDLCSFWKAWESDGLDSEKGLGLLTRVLGLEGQAGGADTYELEGRLEEVVGRRARDAWSNFPFQGRYAARPLRDTFAQLDHQYDDFADGLLEGP